MDTSVHPAALTTGVTEAVQGNLSLATSERTPLLAKDSTSPSPRDVKLHLLPPDDSPSLNNPTTRALHRTRLFLALSYASLSGVLSGMCLLFAKSGVELLLLTVKGDNQFYRWESWILVLALVVFALLQLWYMHKALVGADPTIVCPCTFSFSISTFSGFAKCIQYSRVLLLQPLLDCQRSGVLRPIRPNPTTPPRTRDSRHRCPPRWRVDRQRQLREWRPRIRQRAKQPQRRR